MNEIRRIAVVANIAKPEAVSLAGELVRAATDAGVSVAVPETHPLPAGALDDCDACVTLGGDGTLLGVVAEAAARDVPVFGINRGKLGFLANYPADNAVESLRTVLRGEYQFSRRALLELRAHDGTRAFALNDIVVAGANRTGLARLRVSLSGEFLNSFLCDGLIVATPTGSTAYNLSAGGPLVDPEADVFAVTPICPHTLSNRSLIFPRGRTLEIVAESDGEPLRVEVDGVHFRSEIEDAPMRAHLSERALRLIQPRGFSHFEMLRNKLRWA